VGTVEELNRIEDLAAVRDAWEAIYRVTPGAMFFQSLPWLEAYWRHFGAGQTLRVFVERDGGEVVGIVPLVVRRERTRLGTLRFLTYPLDYWGSFYGPIGRDPQRSLAAALAQVRHTKQAWDVIELRWVSAEEDGDVAGGDEAQPGPTAAALAGAGFKSYPTVLDRTSVIDLQGTFEAYLSARGSKYRNNYRRWERKLAERGEVRLVRFRPEPCDDGASVDPRWDLYDACEEIARQSWQSDSHDGTTLCSEAIRPFLRDAHAAAAAHGSVDLNLLTIGERPAAFVYNYRGPGGLYSFRVGYLPELASAGAGNVLYLRVIADSLLRGDATYDLGPGSFEAKRYIKSREATIYRHSHYAPLNVRAQLMRLRRRRESMTTKESPATDALTAV
jgi:CelD/BcsL family acetyltransferase involved in cellulose biosynthesis